MRKFREDLRKRIHESSDEESEDESVEKPPPRRKSGGGGAKSGTGGPKTTGESEDEDGSALRSKLVGLLVVLKMKIMRIMIYCVYWGTS